MKENYKSLRIGLFALETVLVLSVLFQVTSGQATEPFDISRSPLPPPTSPIMDYADVVDAETEKRIETKLIEFRDSSSPTVELAVAIVKTTGDIPIFDYSLAVARGWKMGTTKEDNPAALLLVAIEDRKYFTQVDYDLEDELPDGIVGSLQRQFLVPEFKQGNYGKGIEDTIDAYIATIRAKQAGEANPFAESEEDQDDVSVSTGIDSDDITCCIIGLIAFIIFIVVTIRRASKNAGSSGGGRPDYASAAGEVAIDVVGGLILGGLLGGGSGSSSSDSWGGSSGDWGGFGGGGDFGGGGSGGSW